MNVPFSACVGADIENLIYTGNIEKAARFFIRATKDLAKQNKIILYIPQGILDCVAHNAYIKAVRQHLSVMTQAKVTICRDYGSPCTWNTNAPIGFSTTAFMQGQIQRRELPFSIGMSNIDLKKDNCGHCPSGRPCSAAMIFYAKHLNDTLITDLESTNSAFIKKIAEQALTVFYQNFTLDTATQILLARLLFIREGLDCSRLSAYDQVRTSSTFFEDANKVSAEDKRNIVLSAARAFCFPPVKHAAKREKGSLDWHKDIQPLPDEVEFFRADVLPGLQTGRQHSGVKRLLFGRRRRDNQLLLFGYTADHDFDAKKLQNRWLIAERELV